MSKPAEYDTLDRQIINTLQGGFPIVDKPYAQVASWLNISSEELIERLDNLLESGALTRFGPLFNSQRMGGEVTLAALCVPSERYDEVTEIVNSYYQVAHNYQREHAFNMWFVITTETPGEIKKVIRAIENETGLKVYDCPKEKEYFIGLRLQA
ncbi:MAG: Lrp/AsnC family transcriptional regulator [Hyphomicrobiales bacterium]|nr:Lrp/AsnC family transcriptional regulator [Hyphomicrobiales bacterium]